VLLSCADRFDRLRYFGFVAKGTCGYSRHHAARQSSPIRCNEHIFRVGQKTAVQRFGGSGDIGYRDACRSVGGVPSRRTGG